MELSGPGRLILRIHAATSLVASSDIRALHRVAVVRRGGRAREGALPRRTERHDHLVEPGERQVEYAADRSFTQTVAGRERLYIARGDGPIASQVGRIVFAVDAGGNETIPFIAGKWDLDLFPELCAYLA
jgi:hypothetical protein